jgi:FlaA1/EpsC-like NDP-sugar epimerase
LVIYHAIAYKQMPMVKHNATEAGGLRLGEKL